MKYIIYKFDFKDITNVSYLGWLLCKLSMLANNIWYHVNTIKLFEYKYTCRHVWNNFNLTCQIQVEFNLLNDTCKVIM